MLIKEIFKRQFFLITTSFFEKIAKGINLKEKILFEKSLKTFVVLGLFF